MIAGSDRWTPSRALALGGVSWLAGQVSVTVTDGPLAVLQFRRVGVRSDGHE